MTNEKEKLQNTSRSGIPVDASGGPTVDPTRNVLDLVNAAVKRLDDLAEKKDDLSDSELQGLRRELLIHVAHLKELMQLRADHAKDLMTAEAKRIDAIRVVDVQAVSVASGKASDQALVLSKQVTESAETQRKLVADTASATATQLAQIIKPITDNIALLQKAQYEGAGKEGVTEPIFNKLIEKIDAIGKINERDIGKGIQTKDIITYILLAIAIGSFLLK